MNTRRVLALSLRVTDTRNGQVLDRLFDRFPTRIGRSALADLQLDFGFVSQFHALIEKKEERFFLRDLGSTNGTLFSGEKLKPHQPVDLTAGGLAFQIGPLQFAGAAGMVDKTRDEGTAVMMAMDAAAGANATEVWQAFVDAPARTQRDPRDVALQGLRYLASYYVPSAGKLEDAESVMRFLNKMKQALDLLFGAFLPLRDGCRQFQKQVAVRPDASDIAATVAHTRSPLELASKLLDWREGSHEALRAVQEMFADFVIHQLAVIDGTMRGVKALLDDLSPKTIEALHERRGGGKLFRAAALWKLYGERHGDFADDASEAFAVIFGREFQQAYRQFFAEQRSSMAPPAPSQAQPPPR
jgi:predicted component of type VI protein secretion system